MSLGDLLGESNKSCVIDTPDAINACATFVRVCVPLCRGPRFLEVVISDRGQAPKGRAMASLINFESCVCGKASDQVCWQGPQPLSGMLVLFRCQGFVVLFVV